MIIFSSSAMVHDLTHIIGHFIQWAAGRVFRWKLRIPNIQFLVFYYGSHIVRKFDIRLHRLSFWMTVCECQHIISGSFNHFIEYGRWGSAHIDSLSIPAIQRNDFVVQIILRGAVRTWNLWRIDREFQRHTDWNLQFIHDRLDVYVPNHIFSTTLARIHRRQSFIFYASHAAEHNMTMEITTTNGHRLPLRSPSAIILRPKDFLNFFLFSRRLWLHSHSTGVPVTWYFRTCFLWDHILRGCTKLHIWTTLQLSQCSRKAVSVCSVLSKSTLD